MTDPKLTDEAGRLLALHRYCALDSVHEPNFDTITSIVRDLLGAPICAVSLIDSDQQRFKSIQGLGVTHTPREVAFCDHTIRTNDPLVVPEATEDPRFANNPLVTGEPHPGLCRGPADHARRLQCRRPLRHSPPSPRLYARGPGAAGEVRQGGRRPDGVEDAGTARFLTGALSRRAFTDAASAALHRLESQAGP